jgi:hypothetical protein
VTQAYHLMTCKNCSNTYEGNFCPNCGQSTHTHRITLGHFFHEFFHAFTHADKGIILLAKELIIRPGHVAREYLDGKRKKYFNPLSFLILTTAIYAFATYQSGYFKALIRTDERKAAVRSAPEKERPSPQMITLFKAMGKGNQIVESNNGKVLALVLLWPLLALFTWLFSLRSKRNFAEMLVLSAFIMGELYIIMCLIFIPAYLLWPSTAAINNMVFQVVSVVFMLIAFHQFFKSHIVWSIIKTILVKVLYVFFFWILIVLYVFAKDALFA